MLRLTFLGKKAEDLRLHNDRSREIYRAVPSSRFCPELSRYRTRRIGETGRWVAYQASHRLAHGHYGRCENISRAALGADELGPHGFRLELPPQASHLHVDRTVVYLVVVQAREVEQLIT